MKIYHGFHDAALRPIPRCVAIGVFDGVHRGHQKILKWVARQAKHRRLRAMVVTFDPDPHRVLKPRTDHPILMSLSHRLRFFERLGMEEALVVRFNRRFSKITHPYFVRALLLKRLAMRALAVGADFRFGRGGRGDTPFLRQESKRNNFLLCVIAPLKQKRAVVSSTRIRRCIETGRLAKAAKMLGRPVSVYGTVVHGRGRGRSVGFPTANLNPHHETLPPRGVYAAWGLLNSRILRGMIHIGERPTFKDKEKSLEVHFLDFQGDLYGKEVELIFLKPLRPIRRFRNRTELAQAIRQDIERAQLFFRKAFFLYKDYSGKV